MKEISTDPEERVRTAEKRPFICDILEARKEDIYRSSKAPPPKYGSKIRWVKGRSMIVIGV
jgi:hypothetical protein